jgi:Tfp pilus assembly protein PilN
LGRQGASKAGDAASTAGSNETASTNPAKRRFLVTFFASLSLPVLLSVPIVLMLRYDTGLRRNANAVLRSDIGIINAQIADISDLNKVKSNLLARKQIIEQLQLDTPRAAALLGIGGRLPNDVQLLSLEMNRDHVALALRCATPSAQASVQDLLKQNGYRNVQVVARQRESDSAVERISIEADLARGDGQ